MKITRQTHGPTIGRAAENINGDEIARASVGLEQKARLRRRISDDGVDDEVDESAENGLCILCR